MNGERAAAASMVVGGALWTITGLEGLGATKGSGGFYAAEVGFICAHLLVLPGLIALARSEAITQRWARNALGVAVAGRGLFLIAEVAAIVTANDELPLFPLAAASTALGMVVGGIGVVRGRRWAGWHRWTPLVMGVYPFVAMFPLLAATGNRPNTAVALWGLAQSAVGIALAIESTHHISNDALSGP